MLVLTTEKFYEEKTILSCIRTTLLVSVQTFAERTIGKFSKLVPFFVACSTIGSLNGAILGGSR